MSDARVRELERRWRDTGAVTDEAALLSEQLRTGLISAERVEVAAWADHAAAVLALGESRVTPPGDPIEWLGGLERWSPSLAVWALSHAFAADVTPESAAACEQFEAMHSWVDGAFLGSGIVTPPAEWAWEVSRWQGARASQLSTVAHRIRRRQYLQLEDEEIERATDELWGQMEDPARWAYNHSQPYDDSSDGWYHHFVRRHEDRTMWWKLIDAETGWEPPADALRLPAGRVGCFVDTTIHLHDAARAGEAARGAARSWALSARFDPRP